jgi:glycine/serine hydroxymethyltransferase
MRAAEMQTIAQLIARTLRNRAHENELTAVKAEVADLCGHFPAYA